MHAGLLDGFVAVFSNGLCLVFTNELSFLLESEGAAVITAAATLASLLLSFTEHLLFFVLLV